MNRAELSTVYLIPGLGADERVFQFLQLAAPSNTMRWSPVEAASETLPAYAARLAAAVPTSTSCWLVGVSFGGVLALEVARLRPLAQVVLVSSFTGPAELPLVVRLAGAIGLHRLLPPQLLPHVPRLMQWFFSVRNGAEYKLLRQIIRDTDPQFARWAINALLMWRGAADVPAIRIHGTHDRLLPAGAKHSTYTLPGGHFIIVSQARQISLILDELIGNNLLK